MVKRKSCTYYCERLKIVTNIIVKHIEHIEQVNQLPRLSKMNKTYSALHYKWPYSTLHVEVLLESDF